MNTTAQKEVDGQYLEGAAVGASEPQHGNASPGDHRKEALVERRGSRSGESSPGGIPAPWEESD